MPDLRAARRIALRSLAVLFGLWILAAVALGVAYLTHGWKRLDTLPTPDRSEPLSAFRPYAEHAAALGDGGFPYVLRLDPVPGGGAVLFFGARHTKDPDDPQIARIEELWDDFHPTVALCESRLGLYIGGLRGGVAMFGEVGAPYALARRDEVPVHSLEPDWETEIAVVRERFSLQEVAAFYFLRRFQSERGDRRGAEADGVGQSVFADRMAQPGLEGAFASIEEFDRWWADTLADELGDWRSLPERAMWPTDEGEALLNRLALASNRARDEHLTRLLVDLARRGERVFVVCGGSHALTIEPPLRAALGADP